LGHIEFQLSLAYFATAKQRSPHVVDMRHSQPLNHIAVTLGQAKIMREAVGDVDYNRPPPLRARMRGVAQKQFSTFRS